ncbi:hypothetical protein RRG08_049159 [Elysia crispata]|uniref:Uncharacterized protein n=1 Tax=Elysia crispata TaxID=231223 RepID=A0AAE1ARL1_9GAST|nr:hypothetical protein RRG08_049159 [Elysia crispata]
MGPPLGSCTPARGQSPFRLSDSPEHTMNLLHATNSARMRVAPNSDRHLGAQRQWEGFGEEGHGFRGIRPVLVRLIKQQQQARRGGITRQKRSRSKQETIMSGVLHAPARRFSTEDQIKRQEDAHYGEFVLDIRSGGVNTSRVFLFPRPVRIGTT